MNRWVVTVHDEEEEECMKVKSGTGRHRYASHNRKGTHLNIVSFMVITTLPKQTMRDGAVRVQPVQHRVRVL